MQSYTIWSMIWEYSTLIFMLVFEILILRYFMKEIIKNIKQNKAKPNSRRNDIKRRLEKANRKYYKSLEQAQR